VTKALENALQYRLQYEAPDKLPGLYRPLTFYLQIYVFQSGADGIRTHALRRAKGDRYILARPSVSGILDVLQAFCNITGGALSAACQLVLARLQYGCSSFSSTAELHRSYPLKVATGEAGLALDSAAPLVLCQPKHFLTRVELYVPVKPTHL
jgi:hypothetical protein